MSEGAGNLRERRFLSCLLFQMTYASRSVYVFVFTILKFFIRHSSMELYFRIVNLIFKKCCRWSTLESNARRAITKYNVLLDVYKRYILS